MRRAIWVLGAVLAGACGGGDDAGEATEGDAAVPEAAAPVMALVRDTAGNVVGDARFTAGAEGVDLRLEVNGLPAGRHGVHLHEFGACDARGDTAFAAAGGHFNPQGRQHGLENPQGPHAGDLPNLEVGEDGHGVLEATAARGVASPVEALLDADGTALIVHANEDDQRTDSGPAGPGNSGGRIACGVIVR